MIVHPSESYPYLALSVAFGVPYSEVLHLVDQVEMGRRGAAIIDAEERNRPEFMNELRHTIARENTRRWLKKIK